MLKKQENDRELQDLKNQIQELREEIRKLNKLTKNYKLSEDNLTITTKIGSSYNNQLINQISKVLSGTASVPNSFSG